jgi:hypothetical protein
LLAYVQMVHICLLPSSILRPQIIFKHSDLMILILMRILSILPHLRRAGLMIT